MSTRCMHCNYSAAPCWACGGVRGAKRGQSPFTWSFAKSPDERYSCRIALHGEWLLVVVFDDRVALWSISRDDDAGNVAGGRCEGTSRVVSAKRSAERALNRAGGFSAPLPRPEPVMWDVADWNARRRCN